MRKRRNQITDRSEYARIRADTKTGTPRARPVWTMHSKYWSWRTNPDYHVIAEGRKTSKLTEFMTAKSVQKYPKESFVPKKSLWDYRK